MSKDKTVIIENTATENDLSIRLALGTRIAVAAMILLFFITSWFASAG